MAAGDCHTLWLLAPLWGEIHFVKDDGMRFLDISGDLIHDIWMQIDTFACDPNGLLENRFRAFGPK